uniref:glucuronosyltransferase n=1 Tax=Meloidogyne incognita TaxID=6306 RepID=A0A914NA18_MELIC
MGKADIKKMFELFEEYSHCIYKVKLIKEYLPKNYNKNIIDVSEENIPQQELLSKTNTKLFISHCGTNSLNEAIYAGVPLICIPYAIEQFYNSSLVEHLGIGKYVALIKIVEEQEAYPLKISIP